LWLNHAFSNVHNFCQLLRQGFANPGLKTGLTILLSHDNPQFVARPLADEFFLDRPADESYADWVLTQCRQRAVDLIWPFRGARILATRRAELEKQGTRLMVCADPETLDILNDKAAFYQSLGDKLKDFTAGDHLSPRYRLVQSLPEFLGAVAELSSQGGRVCFKPAKSIYGLGFKAIIPEKNALAAYMASEPHKTTLAEATEKLAVPPERFPRLLVMELLPGPEYSVDVLAKDGRVLRAAIREKPLLAGRPEKLIYNERVLAIAQKLTAIFRLSHLFNLQLIASPTGLKILEINPRAAGGLYFSCLGGLNYPYWAVRLALGADENLLPEQTHDLWVTQAYQPFIYETD
jgi:hypothetical protein